MSRTPDYQELTIRITSDAEPDTFLAQVTRSPLGGRQETRFRLPSWEDGLQQFVGSLERHVKAGGQRGLAPHTAPAVSGWTPRSVGETLFGYLFRDRVRDALLKGLDSLDGKRALRIRLLFDPEDKDFPALSYLPWELLFRADTRGFLSQDVRTPLVRQIDVPHTTLPPPRISSLKALVVLSCPSGLPPLDVKRELEKIESTWGAHSGVRLLRPERATIQEVRRLLREEPFDVLHFVGHGGFEREDGPGVVYFEDGDGGPHAISGELLADTLKSFSRVRLVFLNACETARLARRQCQDPYQGVAAALLIGGVPAVLAMQFPISDAAAIVFADMFYKALALGDPVDVAVTEGRLAVRQQDESSWEWATPVLFLSVSDARLFDLAVHDLVPEAPREPAAATAPQESAAETEPLAAVEEQILLQSWEDAVTSLEQIRKTDPKNVGAYFLLALARIAGRRPRSLTLDVVGRIETDLRTALRIAGEPAPAHVLYLWALVKHDFYRFNGMRVPPPAIEELLAETSQGPCFDKELRYVLQLVPTPPNPVRDALEKLVESLS